MSLPCPWLPTSLCNVPYAQLADIDFSTPQLKRKKEDFPTSRSSEYSKAIKLATLAKMPSAEELTSLYTKLSNVGKPAILSLVPEICDSCFSLYERYNSPTIDMPIIFSKGYLDLTYPDLLDKCELV